jgi:hypothetical protein
LFKNNENNTTNHKSNKISYFTQKIPTFKEHSLKIMFLRSPRVATTPTNAEFQDLFDAINENPPNTPKTSKNNEKLIRTN